MSTAFNSIHAALVAALVVAPALAAGRVYINRLRPISATSSTAIVVRLDQSSADNQTLGTLDWSTAYSVECYARAAAGGDPAAAVDILLLDVWARLSVLSLASLGVMAITLQPQIDWQYDDADTPVACAVIHVNVQHRTTFANLTPWA